MMVKLVELEEVWQHYKSLRTQVNIEEWMKICLIFFNLLPNCLKQRGI